MQSDRKESKAKAMARVARVESILRRWDPIGVRPGELAPADEYDSYAPHIVSLVEHGCSVQQLAQHLEKLRTETIGVKAYPERDMEIAREIVESLRREAL
ncbi:MAG: hypothetical protein Kow0062_25140 [Acidobacteriota bacterium]